VRACREAWWKRAAWEELAVGGLFVVTRWGRECVDEGVGLGWRVGERGAVEARRRGFGGEADGSGGACGIATRIKSAGMDRGMVEYWAWLRMNATILLERC
jgi:hypothetical protein